MDYTRAYKFVFKNEKWWQNLLLGAVCAIIPIVGPIVFFGYLCRVMDSLLNHESETYPDFDFGQFGNYLKRGVWPFLVVLVVTFVFMPVLWVCMLMPMFGGMLLKEHPFLAVPLMLLSICVYLVALVTLMLVIVPLLIRACICRDFAMSFSWTFVKDFFRLTWKELLLSTLFLCVSGTIVVCAGMCLCCVGVYPAAVLAQYAQFCLYAQLYKLYLERGGEPVPVKE